MWIIVLSLAGTAAGARGCLNSLQFSAGSEKGCAGGPPHRFYDGRVALLEAGVACALVPPPAQARAPDACACFEGSSNAITAATGLPSDAGAEHVKQSMLGSRVGGSGRLRTQRARHGQHGCPYDDVVLPVPRPAPPAQLGPSCSA